MLKPELEQLIRHSLRALDAVELESVDGVHRYQLRDGLQERLGRDEILITFAARTAAQRDDVDLVTVGSYLYDLILRLVREKGRAAAGWLAPSPEVDPVLAVQRVAPRLKDRPLKPVKRTWGVIYLFTFRFGFHFDTPHEKLYTVRVDHDGERIRHDVHPWRLVEPATPDPPLDPAEWGSAPHIDPERAFRFAWEKVEEEVARLTAKYGQEAEATLQEEIQTVELYYRQLIEEEKRVREQKNTRRGREESEQKIETLKLDWDRRVAEEKKRLRPEVSVQLSCAAYLRVPLQRWRCQPRGGTREAVAEFWVDLHSGEAWPARATRRKAPKAGRRGSEQEPEDGQPQDPRPEDRPPEDGRLEGTAAAAAAGTEPAEVAPGAPEAFEANGSSDQAVDPVPSPGLRLVVLNSSLLTPAPFVNPADMELLEEPAVEDEFEEDDEDEWEDEPEDDEDDAPDNDDEDAGRRPPEPNSD